MGVAIPLYWDCRIIIKYKIIRTDKTDEQLRDIIFYIAEDSGSIDTTLNYLDKVETEIGHLEEFPMSGSKPKRGYYICGCG